MFVPLSVLDFRDRAAAFFGDKVGVIDGDRQFTYREFGERTHRLANALAGLGVAAGDRVSFITYNTHHLLEAYYGVLEAGAVLNPINIRLAPARDRLHPRPRRLAGSSSSTATSCPWSRRSGRASTAPADLRRSSTARPGGIADHEIRGPAGHRLEPSRSSPRSTRTRWPSCSTRAARPGLPKGVAMTHRELYLHSLIAELGLGFTEDDVVLHVVPLFHVNGWGMPHFLTMIGGRHVMLRRFDPARADGARRAPPGDPPAGRPVDLQRRPQPPRAARSSTCPACAS